MTPKLAAVIFLLVCLAARFFRARLRPLLARALPASASDDAVKGLDDVEHLTTGELIAVVEARLKQDASDEEERARSRAAVARVAGAVLAAPPVDPKP